MRIPIRVYKMAIWNSPHPKKGSFVSIHQVKLKSPPENPKIHM